MKGLPWKKNHQELKDLGSSLVLLFAIPVVWGKFLYRQLLWVQMDTKSKATQYIDSKRGKKSVNCSL